MAASEVVTLKNGPTVQAAEFVCLRSGPAGGLDVPVEPVLLLLDLRDRGFSLRQDGDALVVQPHEQLTADDCQLLRRWHWHLLALICYEPPEVS